MVVISVMVVSIPLTGFCINWQANALYSFLPDKEDNNFLIAMNRGGVLSGVVLGVVLCIQLGESPSLPCFFFIEAFPYHGTQIDLLEVAHGESTSLALTQPAPPS